MGASYQLIREKRVQKKVTERRKMDHFIVGDIDSVLVEGTIKLL